MLYSGENPAISQGILSENTFALQNALQEANGKVHYLEGQVDALSFAQEGWQVVSAITGRFSAEQEKELFETCRRYERVLVCMDGDKMGQKFERDLCRKMLLEGINFVCGFTPKMAA